MDYCHCLHPIIEQRGTNQVCVICRMYFDKKAWDNDPRVSKKRVEAKALSVKQQSLVDLIMSKNEP